MRQLSAMQDLTTGPVSRHLIKTAGFMLVTMIFQTLYFLVDLYWVGRLGKEAVAGVGIAGNLTFIVLAITQMLSVGITSLISHASGQKDRDRAILVFNQAQVLSFLVGAIFLVAAMSVRMWYVRALSPDATTAGMAAGYLLWFIPAMALQFLMVSMGAALRGTGNFKPGMIVSTVTVILNMLLAPVLMFGWLTGRPLGVAGAAISSLVAIVLGTGWLLLYFRPDESYLKVRRADWRPQPAVWKRMLGIGLPAGAEFALMAVYLLVVYGVARPFGAAAQAGFGIGVRIMQSAFLPIVALAFAVAPVAGQNFGARKAERVRETFKVAAAITVATTLAITALCQFAGDAMVHVFSADAGVVAVGDEYLRIVSLSFVCAGLVFIGSSMFQAMGHTLPALLASMIRTVLTVVPALALSRLPGFELRWIWYVAVLASLVHLTVNMLLLRREFRLRFDSPPVALAVQV